jgi:hypothetical protein
MLKFFDLRRITPLAPNLFIHAPTGKSVGSNSNNIEPTDLPVGVQLKEPTDLPVAGTKKRVSRLLRHSPDYALLINLNCFADPPDLGYLLHQIGKGATTLDHQFDCSIENPFFCFNLNRYHIDF